jgi:secreted trypsin-like serine protease
LGIVSFGNTCAAPNAAGVYTKISKFSVKGYDI